MRGHMNGSWDVRYFVGKPTKTRKTFVLVCYKPSGRRKVYQEVLPALRATVSAINAQYLTETITLGQAELLIKELILEEYRKAKVPARALRNSDLSHINQVILEKFWVDVYSTKYLEDEKSPRYDLQKALRLIEPLSIQTASALELQTQLKRSAATAREIRRATDRINQLLTYLKRGFRLNKPKVGMQIVNYLTYEEFKQILIHLPDTLTKDFASVLFGTGMRLGEALAATPKDYYNGHIMVDKQIAADGKLKLPKREKVGKAVVITFAHEALLRWLESNKKESKRYSIYVDLISACQKAFPNQKEKWCSPHDLRHSHAIYLLSLGANLTQVALNLRNRVDVCQMYYTGFAHSEGSLDTLKKLVK